MHNVTLDFVLEAGLTVPSERFSSVKSIAHSFLTTYFRQKNVSTLCIYIIVCCNLWKCNFNSVVFQGIADKAYQIRWRCHISEHTKIYSLIQRKQSNQEACAEQSSVIVNSDSSGSWLRLISTISSFISLTDCPIKNHHFLMKGMACALYN